MKEEHKKALGIDAAMKVVPTGSRNQNRRGQDTDIDSYDVFDDAGELIAKCEVWNTISMFPPQKQTFEYKKYTPDGKQVI